MGCWTLRQSRPSSVNSAPTSDGTRIQKLNICNPLSNWFSGLTKYLTRGKSSVKRFSQHSLGEDPNWVDPFRKVAEPARSNLLWSGHGRASSRHAVHPQRPQTPRHRGTTTRPARSLCPRRSPVHRPPHLTNPRPVPKPVSRASLTGAGAHTSPIKNLVLLVKSTVSPAEFRQRVGSHDEGHRGPGLDGQACQTVRRRHQHPEDHAAPRVRPEFHQFPDAASPCCSILEI